MFLVTISEGFSMNKNYSQIIVLSIVIISFPIIHEIGHFIIARIMGGEIIEFTYLYVSLLPGSIDNIQGLILFKYGGLIFTFYPSLITYLYLYKINSRNKNIFLFTLFLSLISSTSDFMDIYKLIPTT
jgi:hypothetical protein